MDTRNLTELVDLGLAVEQAAADVFAGGSFHPDKVGQIFSVFPLIAPAIEGLNEVPSEVADLSVEEVEALVAHVVVKLALDDKSKGVVVVEKAVKVGFAAWELYKALK